MSTAVLIVMGVGIVVIVAYAIWVYFRIQESLSHPHTWGQFTIEAQGEYPPFYVGRFGANYIIVPIESVMYRPVPLHVLDAIMKDLSKKDGE